LINGYVVIFALITGAKLFREAGQVSASELRLKAVRASGLLDHFSALILSHDLYLEYEFAAESLSGILEQLLEDLREFNLHFKKVRNLKGKELTVVVGAHSEEPR